MTRRPSADVARQAAALSVACSTRCRRAVDVIKRSVIECTGPRPASTLAPGPADEWPFELIDVFFDVPVIGEDAPKNVPVLQHPCVIRRGLAFIPKLLVAEVRPERLYPPSKWLGLIRQMPLTELVSAGDDYSHYAAFFVDHQLVRPDDLDRGRRMACMSQRGVNLLMQRWVHHNSRVVVPTQEYQDATSPQFEEADLIEEWCADRADDGIALDDASVEIDTWLTGDKGPTAPRSRLEDAQHRSAVRREMRACLRKLRGESR